MHKYVIYIILLKVRWPPVRERMQFICKFNAMLNSKLTCGAAKRVKV